MALTTLATLSLNNDQPTCVAYQALSLFACSNTYTDLSIQTRINPMQLTDSINSTLFFTFACYKPLHQFFHGISCVCGKYFCTITNGLLVYCDYSTINFLSWLWLLEAGGILGFDSIGGFLSSFFDEDISGGNNNSLHKNSTIGGSLVNRHYTSSTKNYFRSPSLSHPAAAAGCCCLINSWLFFNWQSF